MLTIFKVLIATCVAKALRRINPEGKGKQANQPFLVQMLVDDLTAMVHEDFDRALCERDWKSDKPRDSPIKIKRFESELIAPEKGHKRYQSGASSKGVPPIKLGKQISLNSPAFGNMGVKTKADKKPPFH